MANYKIDYSETKFKSVNALTTDTTGGIIIPNGETVAVVRFRADGADPSAYVFLTWDYSGAGEKIIASTKGDIDLIFDVSLPDIQFAGDGSKKIQIIIENNNLTASPIIGGAVEVVRLG